MTTTPTSTKPNRHLLRFSLRTLLVVLLLLGCGLGWIGVQVQQARRHVAVVKEIERLGGQVHFPAWKIPAWKKGLFGVYAIESGLVYLRDTDATDSILARMKGMKCGTLYLANTKITDDGLKHLRGMTSLRWLALSNTQITDAGLVHLNDMTSLKILDLNSTQITDAGLAHLAKHTKLRFIYLSNSMMSQEAVDRFRKAHPTCEIHYGPRVTTSDSTAP